ncbi:MAG: hypothetical protein HYZ33_02965 [Ignavibacteriales bacterium]|nr:hypothetical protein [Ignavibacteriales bacterium]
MMKRTIISFIATASAFKPANNPRLSATTFDETILQIEVKNKAVATAIEANDEAVAKRAALYKQLKQLHAQIRNYLAYDFGKASPEYLGSMRFKW